MKLWYSDIYTGGISAESRFPRLRYRLVQRMLAIGAGREAFQLIEPQPLSAELIALSHSPQYVLDFVNGDLTEKAKRRIGLRPWTSAIIERTLKLTGGTVEATRAALREGSITGNLGGGTHHAFYDHGAGYCIFNDLVIAAHCALREGCERVMIIDLDVHQGDGTAAMLQDEPRVFTFSAHCKKNFPFHKQHSDLDIELAPGTEDQEYEQCVFVPLSDAVMRFRPELILFQAGVDPLGFDRLGKLELSFEGLRRRNRLVMSLVTQLNVPCVITMGGGYSDPLEHSVRAHADVYLAAIGLS